MRARLGGSQVWSGELLLLKALLSMGADRAPYNIIALVKRKKELDKMTNIIYNKLWGGVSHDLLRK